MSSNSQSVILKSIASSLSRPVYWEKKQYQDWIIINYYKKLIEVNPAVIKRTAARLLKNDLTEQNVAFISNKDKKKKIKGMLLESKKPTDIITEFWKEHNETIKKLALQDAVDGRAVTPPKLALKKRLRNRKQKQKESETAMVHDAELIESDNVFVAGCDISVRTMVKRAAYNLHKMNQPMSYQEMKDHDIWVIIYT